MGVHGLWKLLAPTGKPVTLESLEGKVLAVDVSIWLNQAMYGMQGYQATRANAHLVVLFNRICKLLHYKIKPIFVFDGVAPELKKHTLNARRKRKELAEARAKRATDRIVKNYLKSHALNELSKDTQSTKGKKPSLSRMLPKSEKDASIFELPPLPEDTKQRSRTILDEKEDMYLDRIDQQEAVEAQFDDINDIDINSEEFRCLPEEIQHEVITNIRESRKKPFWSRFKELPKKADDFSSYQLSRLLKKGKMSHRLDELQKDMKTKTSGDLAVLLDYETRLQAFEAGRVASEDAQHYLLIKNKPQNDEKKESDAEEENEMEVRNFDQKRPPLEGDYKTLEVMSRMEAGDDERSRKYGDFGQAKTIADGGHHLPSSTRLAPAESAETRRKNQIRHEVLQFFREYNTSVKGQKNDNKVDSDEKVRKKRKSNLIVDEEDQRGLDKRKEDQSSTSPKKKRRHEEITVVEEVEDKLKLKEEGVKKTPKSQQQPGFLGQSDVNLSDEYDSDQEKELNDEKSRSDVVTERIIEDDCTSEDKHSEGTPVSMDVNVVADVPSIQARTLVESDTEGISVMEDEILMVEDEDGREAEEQEGKEVKEIATEGSVTGQDVTKVTEDAENSEHSGEVELLPSEEPGNDVLLIPNLEESENNATLLDESATSSKDSTFMFNQEDFNTMQEKLDLERLNLEKDRGKDQRMSASVTEAMYNETKELLNLFGIPYIESPQEAEAQCAFLDLSGQCQGIITDDSDVWLFGGQRVYKNFFTKDRDVLFYHDQAIERQLTLDRYKLINMALLMGSDYTIGIQGVGFVTALEIMSEFSGDGIEGLERFRKWWEDANNEDISATDAKIRSKLSKVILPSDFPNHVVVRAYLDPEVDKSVEKFTWNSPDLDLLRTYAMEKMGWIQSKTDEILLPVLKRFREKVVQGKISSYFNLQPNVDRERQKIKSKRLQAVLQKLSAPNTEETLNGEEEEEKEEEEEEDSQEQTKERKGHENQPMKENSRKQSNKTVKRGSDPDYSSNMGMVEDISDSDDSDGGPDRASVGRIARGFESDRGRHVWIGKTNQRKLFAKNNKGYGRSWQKHTWQDEDEDGPSPSEATGHIAEDETATKKDVKPDSYWEDQISDTEYDVDELVSAASVAGKMIGGARASRIMTNLEKSYNDEGEEDGGGDKEKEEDGQAGRRKTKTHSKRGKSGKQEIPVNDGKRGTGRSKQRTVKGRAARGDVEESDEECVGQKKVQKRKQQRENDDENYRIEDEREPERNEEDFHIQAKRRAKRNPYLKKQPPSKVEPALEKRKKIQTVEGEVDQKRKDVEDVDEQNKGKAKRQSVKQSNKNVYDEDEDYRIEDEREPERDEEDLRIQANKRAKRNPYLKIQPPSKVEPALEKRKKIQTVEGEVDQKRKDVEDVDEQTIGKAKQQNIKQNNKNVYDDDEDYRIEDEREPERDEEDLRIQANRRAKRNPYLRKQPQRVTKPTVESRFNDDVDINKAKEKILSLNVKEGKLSQGKRKSGSSRDTVHANKESVLHPRVLSPGKGKRGRGRGKGKQLLNRKTRFKSSTYGPALSESSDED